MVVVAEATDSEAIADALADHTILEAPTVAAAKTAIDGDTDIVILSLSLPGVTQLAESLSRPIIAVVDNEEDYDEFCEVIRKPIDASAVQSALLCAADVAEYQHAVDELYTLCRARAQGTEVSPRELREARYAARERLLAVNRSGTPPLKQLLK